MAVYVSGVNSKILRWARETAGFTVEEASKKLGLSALKDFSPIERLIALESGEVLPTRSLLLKMEKQYRRPLVVFYLSEPPKIGNRGQDFRKLPDSYSHETQGLIDALIRDIQVRQSIMRAALLDDEDFTPLPFVGLSNENDGVEKVINSIKHYIKIDLSTYRSQTSDEEAFKYIRRQIEDSGVFVLIIGDLGSYHTAFDTDVFRGFALSDDIAPFIVINEKDSKTAWTFSLIHELVHIFLGHTGISSTDSDLGIEKFCNNVASDFLLPDDDLNSLVIPNGTDFEQIKKIISEFAHNLHISSSMVSYRLLLKGLIDQGTWFQLRKEYMQLWLRARNEKKEKMRKKVGGPSYYVIRKYRLGENIISLVHHLIQKGNLSTVKAAKVLDVGPKNIQHLIEPSIHTR